MNVLLEAAAAAAPRPARRPHTCTTASQLTLLPHLTPPPSPSHCQACLHPIAFRPAAAVQSLSPAATGRRRLPPRCPPSCCRSPPPPPGTPAVEPAGYARLGTAPGEVKGSYMVGSKVRGGVLRLNTGCRAPAALSLADEHGPWRPCRPRGRACELNSNWAPETHSGLHRPCLVSVLMTFVLKRLPTAQGWGRPTGRSQR